MKKLSFHRFIRTHWYSLLLSGILLIAIALRFANYNERWGLAYDQARDVLVAREALRVGELPLIGPFASAGQFVYGPQWYWILMIFVLFNPSFLLTPWILLSILYVLVVYVMVLIGTEIKGKKFGLLLGLLTAVSTAQIAQSVNLSSPSMVGVVSVFCFFVFIKYIKNDKPIIAGLLGFLIGSAINVHFQAVNLILLGLVALLFTKRHKIKAMLFLAVGLLIPFIPLLIFDLQTNHFESKNILDYFLYGQHKTAIPKRWLTYAFSFWPLSWSRIIGGYYLFGYFLIGITGIAVVDSIRKKDRDRIIFACAVFFLFAVILLRYYKGPLYDSYLVSLHTVVIILTGWVLFRIIQISRTLGIVALLIVIAGSIIINMKDIYYSKNNMAAMALGMKAFLYKSYPQEKTFSLYDYEYVSSTYSLPLVLFLDADGRIGKGGYKIGFGSSSRLVIQDHEEIPGNTFGFRLRDLNASSSAELMKNGWAPVNPSDIFHSTVKWYEDKQL